MLVCQESILSIDDQPPCLLTLLLNMPWISDKLGYMPIEWWLQRRDPFVWWLKYRAAVLKQYSHWIPSTWEYSPHTLILSVELETHLSDAAYNIKNRIVDENDWDQRMKAHIFVNPLTWDWHRCSSWYGFWFLHINYNSIGCQKSFGNRSCMLQATSNNLSQISEEN